MLCFRLLFAVHSVSLELYAFRELIWDGYTPEPHVKRDIVG